MKIFKILLVTAIAFGMMACNNEQDVPQVIDGPEATISVKVFPSSNSPGLRSVGDLSGDSATTSPGLAAESAIKSLEVWVFAGDVLDGYGSSVAATPTEVKDIAAHVGSRHIVVIANAHIGNVITSKTALLARLENLPTDVATKGLIMTAEPVAITLEKGKNYYGFTGTDVPGEHKYHEQTPLAITRVNARVALVSVKLDYTNVPEYQRSVFDALKDVQVAMFNVPNETRLFGDALATNDDFQFGAKWVSPDVTYVGADDSESTANTILWDEVVDANALPIVKTKAPFYYVNENTSTTAGQEMFIVLRAKVYKGNDVVLNLEDLYTDAEGYTYYPVWVNVDKSGYSYAEGYVADGKVLRNTQYNISLTIKGLGRPTIDEVDEAWLDVKVEVAPWAVVNQNVTWGTPPVTP